MKKSLLLFTILFISLLALDFSLSFYGKNYSFVKVHLPFGFNTDYDNLEGFKIEDEGFIQIIGSYKTINDSIIIKRIKKYAFNDTAIYCDVSDQFDKSYIIQIIYDDKRAKGDLIIYNVINPSKINKSLSWYNLDGYNISNTRRVSKFF